MTSISSTPRRPSTAQPASLNTRMSYEAGEALLWERQNARANTHLSLQMKELQAQHDAYETRIAATEAVAEAAEAAVHQVKQLGAKVKAIEEDEKDRPFDGWVKEAVGQLQVAVDGLKGVRGRISGLERKVEGLGEEIEGVRGDGALLRSVVRRLEVLESERRDEVRAIERRDTAGRRQQDAQECAYDEPVVDENPLAVFYGIDTQSPARRQESPSRRDQSLVRYEEPSLRHNDHHNTAYRQNHPARKSSQSPQRRLRDLQPRDEDTPLPTEDVFDPLESAPETNYGWENTQQFMDMQRELAELRAMCRTQEPKHGNDTADATQRPQETLIVHRDNNMAFSDATTEAEAELNDAGLGRFRMGVSQGQVDMLSSDIVLPSSPPKRSETQSARRQLMKRPSIHDPRIPSVNEHDQHARIEPAQVSRNSLQVKIPVKTRIDNHNIPTKRKRVDEVPAQRVTRLRLSDDAPASRKPAASMFRKLKANEEKVSLEADSPALDDNAPTPAPTPAPAPPTRKTYGKQKSAASHLVQTSPQASPSRLELVVTEPAAEPIKSIKPISKPKATTKKPVQQSTPVPAAPSSSKAPAAVKKEPKVPRQRVGACMSCRARHQKCDRTHPTCGRCAKLSQPCEYTPVSASGSTAPSNEISTVSPKKKRKLLPIVKAPNEADREHALRARSATVSPDVPRQRSPAKREMPSAPIKKPTFAGAPTAASSRPPRAKNTQNPKTSPQKKK